METCPGCRHPRRQHGGPGVGCTHTYNSGEICPCPVTNMDLSPRKK